MQIINDTVSFLKTLSFVDVVFFFAVLALMLLVIVLIYFLRENGMDENNNITLKQDFNYNIDSHKDEMTSLKEITEALENAEPSTVNLNKYEEEQEEKAIISLFPIEIKFLLNQLLDFVNYMPSRDYFEELREETIKRKQNKEE